MIECNDAALIQRLRAYTGDVCVCIAGTEILVKIVKSDLIETLRQAGISETRWQLYYHDEPHFLQIEANN